MTNQTAMHTLATDRVTNYAHTMLAQFHLPTK